MNKVPFFSNQVTDMLKTLGIKEEICILGCAYCQESNGYDLNHCYTIDGYMINLFYCTDCNKLSFSYFLHEDLEE